MKRTIIHVAPECSSVFPFSRSRHLPLLTFCSSTSTCTPQQVIEALAAELLGAGLSDGLGDVDESADAVTLETVRETLGAALDDEIRRAEGDEVGYNAAIKTSRTILQATHPVRVLRNTLLRFPCSFNSASLPAVCVGG